MSDRIEYPNNMGPLFANTYEYYSKFLPPIHNWSWTDSIQSSVAYMSYETLRQHQTKLKLKIIYLSDSDPSFYQIIEVCRMYNPRVLILTSMPDATFVPSNSSNLMMNIELKTLVSRGNVNLFFIAAVFPDIKHIYTYSLQTNASADPVTLKRLELFSAAHVNHVTVLNLITAPNLTSLDMYSVTFGDNESRVVKIPSSVLYLRTDANVQIDGDLKNNKFILLQYYGKQRSNNDLSVNELNRMSPIDLIIPENGLSSNDIDRLYKTMRSLGVYVTDENISKYMEKFPHVLSIYGAENKHQKATIRGGSNLYCNFNIFSRLDVWSNVYKSQTWKNVHISRELIKTSNREKLWPSYPSFNRNRVIRLDNNETLFITSTCHNMEGIYELVKKVRNIVDIKTLDIHLRGTCMNENTLKMALSSIFMGKLIFRQSEQIIY